MSESEDNLNHIKHYMNHAKKYLPYILLGIIIITFLTIHYVNLSKFKQLPTCLYGCDLYYHNGGIINIMDGNSYLDNPQILDTYAWVPPLYNYMVAGFGKILSLDSMHAIIFFSLIIQLFSILLFYYITLKITNNKYLSLIPAILVNTYFPGMKYTGLGMVFVMPLFIYSCYVFFKKYNFKSAIFVGITLGLLALTHTNFFTGGVMFAGMLVLYKAYLERKPLFGDRVFRKNFILSTLLMLGIGFIISLITWYVPLFIFHLNLPNPIADYNYFDLSRFSNMLYGTWDTIKNLLFNFGFSGISAIVFSCLYLINIVGYIILLLDKNKNDAKRFFLFLIPAALIAANHFYLTYPLLHTNLFPMRIAESFYIFVHLIFSIYILNVLYESFISRKNILKYVFAAVGAILVVCAILINLSTYNSVFVNARTDIDPLHTNVRDWIMTNTNINDVILSTNENSFMLNGLTGRKGVNFRRAHMGSYVDVDQQYMDAALILYSNDSTTVKELLKKDKVKYVYWDYYWVQSEYQMDDKGNVQGMFDPLLIIYSPERESLLKNNNISFNRINYWLDPSINGDRIKKYDSLLVSYTNYRSFDKPWSPELSQFLRVKKEFVYNNQIYARIYEVNLGE